MRWLVHSGALILQLPANYPQIRSQLRRAASFMGGFMWVFSSDLEA